MSTQNKNIACNVEWDFFCDFQMLCYYHISKTIELFRMMLQMKKFFGKSLNYPAKSMPKICETSPDGPKLAVHQSKDSNLITTKNTPFGCGETLGKSYWHWKNWWEMMEEVCMCLELELNISTRHVASKLAQFWNILRMYYDFSRIA